MPDHRHEHLASRDDAIDNSSRPAHRPPRSHTQLQQVATRSTAVS